MGRMRAEEKFLCVNEIKNATAIIRQPIKYDITQRCCLEFKIQISTLDPMFLASFHITVFINLCKAKLLHRILFEDKECIYAKT